MALCSGVTRPLGKKYPIRGKRLIPAQLSQVDGTVRGRMGRKWLIARVILLDGAREPVRAHFQT